MNILIPMAGNGQRFVDAGYKLPKPLIDVLGKPMIERVVENLGGPAAGRFIFVVRDGTYNEWLRKLVPGCKIVIARTQTAGAACTALLAEYYINTDQPLLIANADQIVEFAIRPSCIYVEPPTALYKGPEAAIYTFSADHPKWSYAAVDEHGFVWGVAEKQPISQRATCGVYWWRRGKDFVRCAQQMIAKNIRVNNEFYIAPVFNEFIIDGHTVVEFRVKRMWGLGTPEDLRDYEDAHRS